jgi:hypothetical protein
MSYDKWGERSILSQAEYLMALVTMVCVLYLVYKEANLKLKFSTEGMYGDAHYLRFMGLDTSRGGRDGMLGGNEPPVYWGAALDESEMSQVSEMNSELDGDHSDPAWIAAAVKKQGALEGRLNTVEGLRGDRRLYGRSGMSDPLAAALGGGNAKL